jgi:hypothetical protein
LAGLGLGSGLILWFAHPLSVERAAWVAGLCAFAVASSIVAMFSASTREVAKPREPMELCLLGGPPSLVHCFSRAEGAWRPLPVFWLEAGTEPTHAELVELLEREGPRAFESRYREVAIGESVLRRR